MRWSHGVVVCALVVVVTTACSSASGESPATSLDDESRCKAAFGDAKKTMATSSVAARDPEGAAACERAWTLRRHPASMTRGAILALYCRDDVSLEAWSTRAPKDVEGAKVMHFWGERLAQLGRFDDAERVFRASLELQKDVDATHAINTISELLSLVQSTKPADQSIQLARLARQQAKLTKEPIAIAYADAGLVDVLLQIGEIETANVVSHKMSNTASPALKMIVEASVAAAKGSLGVAEAQLKRVAATSSSDPASGPGADILEQIAQIQLDRGDIAAARDTLVALDKVGSLGSVEFETRRAIIAATIALSEDQLDKAEGIVSDRLKIPSRDRARVQLYGLDAEIKARMKDAAGAVTSWKRAAESVEAWRASVPSNTLRSGLIARYRHVLEAWLDWHGGRGEAEEAFGVATLMLGRPLLDRIGQRATMTDDAERAIDDVEKRLESRREQAAAIAQGKGMPRRDFTAFIVGDKSVWAIRRSAKVMSIRRIGDRQMILDWAKAFRSSVAGAESALLGEAMFPLGELSKKDDPIAVLLDDQLADITLPALRTGGEFLVERAPIVEVVAPDLLDDDVSAARGKTTVIGNATSDLMQAQLEAQQVAVTLGVTAKLRRQASISAVAEAGNARLLHIATHSRIANGRAALALSDGDFTANDIVRKKLAPRLAVIATCRAYAGGDPDISLTAAFLAAGTSGVVGAKRSLVDDETQRLITEFYALNGAEDPVRALAAAQRKEIRDHRPVEAWSKLSFFGVGGWLGSNQETL